VDPRLQQYTWSLGGRVDIPQEPFLIPTGAITRRHNIGFLQSHTRTITMQYSFFPSAIRTWNTLPQQLASMTSPWRVSDRPSPTPPLYHRTTPSVFNCSPDSTREEGILHGYCSGMWLKEPDVLSSSDDASWNEERFWWYINKLYTILNSNLMRCVLLTLHVRLDFSDLWFVISDTTSRIG
jgi:hypothetical protein